MNALRAMAVAVTLLVAPVLLCNAADLTPRQIYERAAPGVVVVIGTEEQGKGSTGTGAIIQEDGLVFTNAHVVMNKETNRPFSQLLVVLKPDRVVGRPDQDYAKRFKARAVAINRELDLAALRFDAGNSKLRVLPMSNPDRLQIGDWVAAIGHPEQGGLWTYTTGVVSAEFEDFQNTKGKHVFQTEIGMNRGNSGGPLLDVNGHVVGINTSIARLAPDGLPITSISFSVKSSVLKQWLGEQGITLAYAEVPTATAVAPVSSAPVQTTPSPPVASVPVPPPSPPSTMAPTPAPAAPVRATPPPPSAPVEAPKVADSPPVTPAPTKPTKTMPAQPVQDPQPFKTKVRPYNPDRLVDDIRRLDSEMEDLAEEMRKKIHPR